MASTITRDGYVRLQTKKNAATPLSIQRTDLNMTEPLAQINMFGPDNDEIQGGLSFETINIGSDDETTEERMRIHTNGNVGIGTDDPKEKLHVDGSIRGNISGALRLNTGYGYVDIGPKNPNWSHFETNRLKFYFNKEICVRSGKIGSYDENLSLCTHGNARMGGTARITVQRSNGNVGIGTTKPNAKLHIVDGKDATLRSDSGFLVVGSVGDANIVIDDNEIMARKNGKTSGLNLQTEGGDLLVHNNQNESKKFVVKDSGNVGIGTNTPKAKLDVNGGAYLGYETTVSNFGEMLKSGFYQNGGKDITGDVPDDSHKWTHLITARHSNTKNNHQLQIAASYRGNNRLFFRKIQTEGISNPQWHEIAIRGSNTFSGDQVIEGNVSIGTTSLTNKLKVNGKLKLPQGAEINEFSTDKTLSSNTDSAVPTEKAVRSYVDKIQSGKFYVGKIEGDGDRTRRDTIHFEPNFSSTPKVILGVTALDVDKGHNLRYKVFYKDLTKEAFTIIFRTWSDTYIYGVTVQWMASGPI